MGLTLYQNQGTEEGVIHAIQFPKSTDLPNHIPCLPFLVTLELTGIFPARTAN